MTAAKLREAATAIRAEQTINEQLGRIDGRECRTWLAVADWLDETADRIGTPAQATYPQVAAALAVANAYLVTGYALDQYAAAADRAEGER